MGRIRLLEIGAVVPETIAAIRVNGLQRTLINLPQRVPSGALGNASDTCAASDTFPVNAGVA